MVGQKPLDEESGGIGTTPSYPVNQRQNSAAGSDAGSDDHWGGLSRSYSRSHYHSNLSNDDAPQPNYSSSQSAIRQQTLDLAMQSIAENSPPIEPSTSHVGDYFVPRLGSPTTSSNINPSSNLSFLLNKQNSEQGEPSARGRSPAIKPAALVTNNEGSGETAPLLQQRKPYPNYTNRQIERSPSPISGSPVESESGNSFKHHRRSGSSFMDWKSVFDNLPNLPSIGNARSSGDRTNTDPPSKRRSVNLFKKRNIEPRDILETFILLPLSYLPAAILGLLMNLLDAISYGMITFPLNMPIFASFGPDGISMFFLSCVVSQLVFSLGGSAFKGGNGSMMIEVVPFLHIIASIIATDLGMGHEHEIIATTIMAFALSTIFTGIVFLLLGWFKLGSLIGFFPRHILVGCIGGVGWFLIVTGVEVSARLSENLKYNLDTFRELFLDMHTLALWSLPLMLAFLLRYLHQKFSHPLFVPLYFMTIPAIFYIIVVIFGYKLSDLREKGWIFPLVSGNVPFWHFYTYFDFRATSWSSILKTIPTMFALTFFGILHVPINVPALAVSLNMDTVDTNRELIAHGWANILSGLVGTVQNYLVYTNSVLFIKSGGDSRVAGVMLAGITLLVFFIGPWIVGYIPVMVVGALIFYLGIDLVKEGLVDTWGTVHNSEYLTIVVIIVTMALFGFTEGIAMGIILACVFFVVTNSQKGAIRATYTGVSARSTVRRLYRQQTFLRQVGNQIYVMKLQGYMFFGTINSLENAIKDVLTIRRWERNPIRFLILDFQLVQGLDFSAAEAFIRIRRLVQTRDIYLVLCGIGSDSDESRALRAAGIWTDPDNPFLQVFEDLNGALEWCENALLQVYYERQATLHRLSRSQQIDMPSSNRNDSGSKIFDEIPSSPRQLKLTEAVHDVFRDAAPVYTNLSQPMSLLIQAFGELAESVDQDYYYKLSKHFKRVTHPAGTLLWEMDAPADALYLIEQGLLRMTIEFPSSDDSSISNATMESIVPGTMVGELGLFTGRPRTSNLVCDKYCVLWRLTSTEFDLMCKEQPDIANRFIRLALNFSNERLNAITSYAFHLT